MTGLSSTSFLCIELLLIPHPSHLQAPRHSDMRLNIRSFPQLLFHPSDRQLRIIGSLCTWNSGVRSSASSFRERLMLALSNVLELRVTGWI